MKIKLKEDCLSDILNHIEKHKFTADGCACGDWAYPLTEDCHIYSHRSCRKSGSTPDNKLWHIHDLTFYKKATYYSSRYNDAFYISEIEVDEEDVIENVKLDKVQYDIIYAKLKEVTMRTYNYEYRNIE